MYEEARAIPLYTPVLKTTGQRLRIENPVFKTGLKSGRGRGKKGVIQDPATGKRYFISGKPCDIPRCQCDAWAVEISD